MTVQIQSYLQWLIYIFLSLLAFTNLGFFDQNLKYCKKFSLMPTVTDTDLFDQTGFIIFKNQNLNFNVYK